MRDWIHTLRPASYKGVGFFVEDESAKTGRNIATHAYVKAESHQTEDMGRLHREYRVSAYLASDDADTAMRSFVDLCSEPGVGTLVLPMQGPVEVRCTLCHVKAKLQALGKIELELEFVEAGAKNDTLTPPAPIGDRQAASALGEMPAAAGTRIDGLDETSRQGALSRRLDPAGSAGADMAAPANDDYQGGTADAAPRNSAFLSLFG
jgi:prophage DNA circulation protein